MRLTAEQQAVVALNAGRHLVLAPPGSGKTEMLSQRIVRAIDSGVNPKKMLCATFTNRAAFEMRDRVTAAADDKTLPEVGNLHHFCHRFLLSVGRLHPGKHVFLRYADFIHRDDARPWRILWAGDGSRLVKLKEADLLVGDEKVVISTIHKAKGRQFDAVVVPDVAAIGSKFDRVRQTALTYCRRALETERTTEVRAQFLLAIAEALYAWSGEIRHAAAGLLAEHGDARFERLMTGAFADFKRLASIAAPEHEESIRAILATHPPERYDTALREILFARSKITT